MGEMLYKMTTNEKHNINKDKLKCVRMKHKESPLHKFFVSLVHSGWKILLVE